ncbi:MAG: hypothetical protein ACKV22_12545 [Bryobacteraceae bacterium]
MRFLPLLVAATALAQQPPPKSPPAEPPPESSKRVELNLLGRTDTSSGESRRNELIVFNLIDNNVLKELNVRLGTTATLVQEFRPERNYFGVEFGNQPSAALHVPPARRAGIHGNAHYSHMNSVFSARKFFQVGGVQPSREHDYGFTAAIPIHSGWTLQVDGSRQRQRGNENGNVLVPRADERSPLATDPATIALVSRWLNAYPLPNRTEANGRLLNTNSRQTIDTNSGGARLDGTLSPKDRAVLQHNYTSQFVNAFQFVPGQNPNTATRSHRARATWNRAWSAATVTDVTAGFDRIGSVLQPEPNSVGPMISVAGVATLGPAGNIPIDRAHNQFRYAAQVKRVHGSHHLTAGALLFRRQFNGVETDTHRGFFSFANDFGRDSITNLRLGIPSQHIIALGDVHRGFRNWDMQYYAGDSWRARAGLQVTYAVRYSPVTRPYEVNHRNAIPYGCDCNNFAPQFGVAWRPRPKWGVLRAAYGLHYGEIFPTTFTQIRFSPPGSEKFVVVAPSLINPLRNLTQTGQPPKALGNIYTLDPNLRTPYAHQYNFAWELDTASHWKLQLGYVGSRQDKLLLMWYLNRAHPVPGIPQTTATINQRRPDPDHAETRLVVNGSRGYYDAARAALVVPRWRGVVLEASYWFSKALDLGSAYSNTAYDDDSRISRSQSEYEQHNDMKGRSSFDQPHAFLVRTTWSAPAISGSSVLARLWRDWSLSSVVLLKSGTPFTVQSGSDGPGFGNVDGNGNDRPNLADPSILGRTIGSPGDSLRLLPGSAFFYMRPTDEFGGNLGRGTFRKGGIYNVNSSLVRSFAIATEKKLTFRAESINLLNTPQFAEPGFELANGNFGVITNTLNDGRTFRFLLQFGW